MNILMVTNEFPPRIGGIQTHVYELSRALVKLGHHVYVLTRLKDPSLPKEETREGINIFRCKLVNSHLVYNWQLRRKLRELINTFNIDIVHVHGMRPLEGCKNLAIPVIFTNHTSSFIKRSQQGKNVQLKMLKQLKVADAILAPSQILADQTRATGYAGPIRFISNGVDIEKFSPGVSGVRNKLNIPESAFVIIMAGRLHAVKGVVYLAKALSLLSHPDLHVIVVGEGSEKNEFETITRSSPCADHIHMLGSIPNDDMPDFYRAADVSILPSLMEATSITGLEAMACGLAVIGTNVGGLPVIINDGVNGLLVEPKSAEALAGAIQNLLSDRRLTKNMGQDGRKRAVNEFSWARIAQHVLDSYNHIKQKFHPHD